MTIFFVFFGSILLAALVAVLFERWGLSHNGLFVSILIATGAALLVFMVRIMFRVSLGSPGLDVIVGAGAALVLIPTEWANRRRARRDTAERDRRR